MLFDWPAWPKTSVYIIAYATQKNITIYRLYHHLILSLLLYMHGLWYRELKKERPLAVLVFVVAHQGIEPWIPP